MQVNTTGSRAKGATEVIQVMFVNHSAALSGAELFLLGMLKNTSAIRPMVLLFQDGPLRGALEDLGIPVTVLAMSDSVAGVTADVRGSVSLADRLRVGAGGAGLLRRVHAHVKGAAPDLVYSNSAKAHVVAQPVARSLGIRSVMHVHDIWNAASFSRANRTLLRGVAVFPELLISNSRATRAGLGEKLAMKSVVIYCPVELPDVRPRPFTGDRLSFAVLGRIAEWKGQHVALEAVRRLRDESGLAVDLHVYGGALFEKDVEYGRHLERLIVEHGLSDVVHLHGHVSGAASKIGDHDALIHSSLRPEPMGQVVLEGMAAGVPVVAAAAGGPLELIEDGVSGLLYNPGDAAALAECLARLCGSSDLRRELGSQARSRAAEFTYDRIIPRWEQELGRVLASPRRGRAGRLLSPLLRGNGA